MRKYRWLGLLWPVFACAVALGAGTVRLSFTDNSDNETGFRVEKRVGTGAWTTLTTLDANVTTAEDAGPFVNGTAYAYRVCAFNTWGDSGWSNTATITPAVPGSPGGMTVTVTITITGS